MNGKNFKSEHVKAAYQANDAQGAFALYEHFFVQGVPCVPYANDAAGRYAMKRPDLLVDGLPVEVQVSRSWNNKGKPKGWNGVMIFKRKMHQTSEKGGAWFTVNARGSHAYRVPFSAVPVREGVYHDHGRGTRDPYVVFDFKDADFIELLKVDGKLN